MDLIQSVNEKKKDAKEVQRNCFLFSNKTRISYLRAKVINALINKSTELYQQHFSEIIDELLIKFC